VKITLDKLTRGTLTDRKTEETYAVNEAGEAYIGELGPMSYRTIEFAERDEPVHLSAIAVNEAEKAILENHAIRIEVSLKTGCISSFYDKQNQKEWAVDGRFGHYEYEVYGKEEILDFVKLYSYDLTDWYINDFGKPGYPRIDHKRYGLHVAAVKTSNGEGWGSIEISLTTPNESYEEFGNGEEISVSIRLEERHSCADIQVTVHHKASTAFAESGHFTFALNANHPKYRFQKLGSVVNPLEDIEKGANTRLHCTSQWVDVQDDHAGLAIIPLDTPLFSIGEKGIFQYSKAYVPQQPNLHFNLFNNQWGTNFPQWISGSFQYSFRLVPHAGGWKEGRIQQQAAEACIPLQTSSNWNPAGPKLYSFLKESVEDIHILAFKKAEQGDEYMLRFQNVLDVSTSVKLSFTESIQDVKECDLVERNKETVVEFSRDHLIVTMNPFEIKTIKLRFDLNNKFVGVKS
jgi:hypothetical protein